MTDTPATIDEYLEQWGDPHLAHMVRLRALVTELVPDATETIKWQMPTFVLHGNLVHFAGGKHHVGFYPGADGVSHFEDELGDYKHSKGAIQFPAHQPLPEDLIRRIVLFRADQQRAKAPRKR